MNKEIELTKDGGFYYRALVFHYVSTYTIFIPLIVLVVLAVINPFWFREGFMRWIENLTNKVARYRDKIKYRIYLGTDPTVWHALKDKQ